MFSMRQSAIAIANNAVVYSNVYPLTHITYHLLFTSLLAISAFNVKHKNPVLRVGCHPYAFGCLPSSFSCIKNLELGIEKQV